ncbi:MAG: hypothetical protein ACTSUE_02335 [Promethearchaeota archaeon]
MFGNGEHETFSDLILENKLAVMGVGTGAFLGILEAFDQPYEILICVLLVLMILLAIGSDVRELALRMTSPKSRGWRMSLMSYVDFLKAGIIMFTTQYATSLISSEWNKVGYSKSDTIIVGIFLILMFVGFLVFFTSNPTEGEEDDE